MEQYQELAHHGILGMKWGVRRYQNPDGTLTSAGKKHYEYQNPDGSLTEKGRKEYMKAAKKGKINYKKLSDADLNMINSRFARENQYKKNIEEYEKSTFKYKAKEAVLARLRGNGGNGGGGKKGGGGGGSHKVAQLLLTPISKAFEDAFKFNPNSGNDDGGGGKEEPSGRVGSFISGSMGKKSVSDLVNSNSRISTGKRFMGVTSTRNTDDWGSGWNTSNNTTSESYLYNKHGYKTPQAKNAERYTSNKRKKRAKHDGMEDGIVFVITRSEEYLEHHGIKGQRWGVRRFQNADGTWTNEGKERYGSDDDSGKSKKDLKREAKDMNSLMKGARKAFRPGNWSESEKLSKNDKINKLADDEELIAKAKKATDLQNKVHALVNRNEEYERKLGVYGDDLDGWDEKDGKENYGIDVKQYNQIMKNRVEYKKVKDEYKQANSEYRQATIIKSKSFVKDYMSKPYAKVKDEGDSVERYSEYVNHLLNVNLDNRVAG